MKKFKSLLSLLALSSLLFTACNNGYYDADPNSDLSDTPNPFEHGGASIGGPGYVSANFNEELLVFTPANWVVDATWGRAVSGVRKKEDGSLGESIYIMFNGTPNGGDSVHNILISYTIMLNDSTIKEQYTNDFEAFPANAFITGFDWYKLLGKFGGILVQTFPGNPEKVITISKGYFDVGKP